MRVVTTTMPDSGECLICKVREIAERRGGLGIHSGNNQDSLDPFSNVTTLSDNITEPTTLPPQEIVGANVEQEIIEGDRVSTTAGVNRRPFSKSMWAFEWRPSIRVGLVKIPYERAFRHNVTEGNGPVGAASTRSLNVLSAPSDGIESFFRSNANKSMILPANADNLVLLEDVSFSRRLITNLTITQGSKYYQVFTENFPEVTITLSVVKFGGVSDRVRHFFDTVTTLVGNPRKYPGAFYMYDVFQEQMDTFSDNLLAENYYRKYKLIPNTINKQVSSTNNLMLKLTITATVVEWEQR